MRAARLMAGHQTTPGAGSSPPFTGRLWFPGDCAFRRERASYWLAVIPFSPEELRRALRRALRVGPVC